MRISDWSSDVCSSDLNQLRTADQHIAAEVKRIVANASIQASIASQRAASLAGSVAQTQGKLASDNEASVRLAELERNAESSRTLYQAFLDRYRSEEHTSELQSLMLISYAVFCLKKKNLKH